MQVRFTCPACNESHVLDMPVGTIHMTCSETGTLLELRLTVNGDVKPKIFGAEEPEKSKS